MGGGRRRTRSSSKPGEEESKMAVESSLGEAEETGTPSSSEDDEEAPKPISSDDDDESGVSEDEHDASTPHIASTAPSSRLFSPYRTLGEVSSGRPFHLIPHSNSNSAMLAVPLQNRFQLVRTDKLQPVMVSQGLPGQTIGNLVTDATLSVTVVTHGRSTHKATHVTLYHRTAPQQTVRICTNKHWNMVDLLHLGRTKVAMSGEKEGKTENVAIVAAILSKLPPRTDIDHVHVVGDESEDDEGDESMDMEDTDDSDGCLGQVVLLIAKRTGLYVQKRIRLSTLPTFCPKLALHPSTYVNKILLAGSDKDKAAMVLLNVRSSKVIHVFDCVQSSSVSSVTALEQSPAVDTVAVGTNEGTVHLVNLRHDKRLFSLRHKSRDNHTVRIQSLSFRTDGSAMQYGIAPLAVGRSDGTITVWDLTPLDTGGRKILCELDRVHPGGVCKLQFLPQEPLLVSTGVTSNSVLLHIFDSPDHSARVLRQRKGHTAPPRRIRYLHPGAGAGGGVLANSSDGTDASACQILSTGGPDRTLRVFSTARTVLDKEYSQGQGLEKRAKKLNLDSKAELLLPPVTAMALSESRSRDWGDLVTIHEAHSFAYVWSSRRGAQWGPVLRQSSWNVSAMKVPPPSQTHATCVAMSACGNFCVVGTRGGIVYKYNVQSGNPRGSYPRDATDPVEERKRKPKVAGDVQRTMKVLEKKMKVSNRASNLDKQDVDAVQEAKLEQRLKAKLELASHKGSTITGVAVDSVNKTMISVGADSKLILWNFATHAPHKKSPYTLPCAATRMCHVRDSDLAAIALEDFTVILFDCSALSIVRRFGASSGTINGRHTGPISDLGFSPDGRSLFTSSLDGTVRVWDVPTNTCVDWLSFETAPTSLTVSPTGEFLATTHTGKLGISVWSDRSFYQTVHVDGRTLLEPARMDDPVPIAETVDTTEQRRAGKQKQEDHTETEEQKPDTKVPVTQKEKGLITLSGLPPAHWKNLFHLELVKERNKPREPPKKPPSAPFFLQWRSGQVLGEQTSAEDKQGTDGKQDEDDWAAAWSDDDEDGKGDLVKDGNDDEQKPEAQKLDHGTPNKRRKVTHYRSHLASLLEQCGQKHSSIGAPRFQLVSDHISTLGPSAIDVELSSLCNGMHDLEEGLPLLQLACQWLLEACESRERFEAVNAYLHRFLHLHSSVISGVDDNVQADGEEGTAEEEKRELEHQHEQRKLLLESVSQLRQAQHAASEALTEKMQQTLCLLRHFSRMV